MAKSPSVAGRGQDGASYTIVGMCDEVSRIVKAFNPQPLNNLPLVLSETFQWAELKLLSFT